LASAGPDGAVTIWDGSPGYRLAAKLQYDHCRRLFRKHRHEEALATLQQLVEKFPSLPEYRKDLAEAFFWRGDKPYHQDDLEKAFPDFDQAIHYNPEYSEALDHRGSIFHARGDLQRAIADYDQAIRFGPAYDTHALRAIAYLETGNHEQAKADLAKAIERSPQSARLWGSCARIRLEAGWLDEYRRDCAEMIERFGRTDKAGEANSVAWACVLAPDALPQWPKAIALAEKAVGDDPRSADYAQTLGAVLYRAGRLPDAIQRLTEADRLVTDPSDPNSRPSPAPTWFFLAMAHHRLGHEDEARKWFDKAAAWTDKALQADRVAGPRLPWKRRATLKLLRAEAETLLKQRTPSEKPKSIAPEKK
jgi:tetratricopeptide (TPR) repeat protein